MKVLFISVSGDTIGGGEVYLWHLASRVAAPDIEPVVLVPSGGKLKDRLLAANVRVDTLALDERVTRLRKDRFYRNVFKNFFALVKFWPSVHKLARYIKKGNFDLVVTNATKVHIYGAVAAYMAGVRSVWYMHDIVSPDFFNGFIRRGLVFAGNRFPELVLVGSNASRSAFIKQGLHESKIRALHYGIDTARFDYRLDAADVAREFALQEETVVVTAIGRLAEWKGHHYFIEAASTIKQRRRNVVFWIVGDSPPDSDEWAKHLYRLIDERGLDSTVKILERRDDVPKLLARTDIFVHPSSRPEPFGLVIVEAMAMKIPVVATNFGGVPEIVVDDETGFLVPPGDANALAEKIEWLMQNREDAAAMGEKGFARVHGNFTIEKNVREVQQVLREAARGRP